MTLEDCLTQQFSKLRVPPQEMLEELDNVTVIRPYLTDLVNYCHEKTIPFTVVSAGLDFVIEHILTQISIIDRVAVHTPHTQFINDILHVTFPPLHDPTSLDFKQEFVKDHQRCGFTVFYIGDAESDFNAVRQANYSFVVRGTPLARLCKTEKIPHCLIDDFKTVIDTLETMRLQN
jgi:2-hydroxy-3-keto-5-methylthiopentenyl-1-phosphate phosphatase